ncbi:MAG: hypothetical protein AAGE89_01465 [Pseudomonadota bacterium]
MRLISIAVSILVLLSGKTFAEGLTSGKLDGKHEDAIQPLVEEIRQAKFGDKSKVRTEERKGKKAKRD